MLRRQGLPASLPEVQGEAVTVTETVLLILLPYLLLGDALLVVTGRRP